MQDAPHGRITISARAMRWESARNKVGRTKRSEVPAKANSSTPDEDEAMGAKAHASSHRANITRHRCTG
ncbi:hypothetical protein RB1203 [Rhodopirellula baltica SH 1]|uniref:Uncharacterized protein n=1 Tax=Rhodopirellula baltica (strain DSM 10527 / NCIMB 13988 / SH1) TaxID=243090 RepID=Q7UXP4_RHOBA|nr:hypothetical protein RB1203 [Rhodopirellula baltica SH 1]